MSFRQTWPKSEALLETKRRKEESELDPIHILSFKAMVLLNRQ